ncbi:hypothetical protein CRG98_026771 [Punica granatum]|uniref:PGG domain-containing protein n=1 Tax=Punica granatum TaxID=22663 RepID=A0A2I0JA12_PUNGR|nr:hypothetical protein CRG98_026771 [Punica granatum]
MDIEMGDNIGSCSKIESEGNRVLGSLYEAAILGSVATLETLLGTDPLVLDRLSLASYPETPLHVAALRGHLEFTKAILKRRANLAAELDAQGCTALHMAAANGHAEVLKVLLGAYPDARLVRDREGRTPLHLAAMRGRVEAIRELFSFFEADSDDALRLTLRGDSALHLSVKYNQLDALKVMVQSSSDNELVKLRDAHGNTILHLAVMLKQEEAVKFLLSVPKVRELAKSLNSNSLSAIDIVQQSPRDLAAIEIEDALINAGVRPRTRLALDEHNKKDIKPAANALVGFLGYFHQLEQSVSDWIEYNRGALMTVATLISGITFQSAITPPGGVLDEREDDFERCINLDTKTGFPSIGGAEEFCTRILARD